MKNEMISHQEQLDRWVAGDSVHRVISQDSGQCCPDFSCCQPELQAAESVRLAFQQADEDMRMGFLGAFLGAAMEHYSKMNKEKLNVYVAGRVPGDEN